MSAIGRLPVNVTSSATVAGSAARSPSGSNTSVTAANTTTSASSAGSSLRARRR
jgi:hypothetical protein